MTFRKAVVAQW